MIPNTVKCEICGAEVECGIINTINHYNDFHIEKIQLRQYSPEEVKGMFDKLSKEDPNNKSLYHSLNVIYKKLYTQK